MADSSIPFGLEYLGIAAPAAEAYNEDELLIEGLKAGINASYEVLLARFEQPVYNLVYRLMDDPVDSCDVVQEVFLKVFRNIGSFQGKSSLKTWIYRISVNEAHNHRRWFSRHKRPEVGCENEEEGAPNYQDILPDPARSAFDLTSDHETHALIENALCKLNPAFREAVVLRDIEDLSYEEIAEVLQVSLGTVKSRILRGREALRKELAGRLDRKPSMQFASQGVRG